MLSNKPILGIAFSLLASALILVILASEAMRAMEWMFLLWAPSEILLFFIPVGWAVLILIGAITLYITPERHSIGGIIVLTFSVLILLNWTDGFILRRYN